MNTKKTLSRYLILASLILISLSMISPSPSQEEVFIVGVWYSKDTPNLKWEFTANGKCYDYYNSELVASYSYSLGKTSPQCNFTVPTGHNFSYLKLINLGNPSDIQCYEILSLNSYLLQVRQLNRGGSVSYIKQ